MPCSGPRRRPPAISRSARRAAALGGDLDKGVEFRIERFGPRQRRLGQRDRRQFTGGELAPGFGEGGERGGAHFAPAS